MHMTNDYPECDGFDWDEGNRDKNLKHAVHSWECEQVFFNEPLIILDDPIHSIAEDRSAAFGKTDSGRQLVIKPSLKSISIRLPEDMLDELKILANKRDVPYQSLAKIYLAWGIQVERRGPK